MTLQSYGIIPEKQEKSSTEDEPSQKIILEYIFSLVRMGIEYVNNKKNG